MSSGSDPRMAEGRLQVRREMRPWVTLVNLAGPGMRIALRRLAWRNRNLYRCLNAIYRPEKVLPERADLIIDGVARSGNWFAFAAFVTAQERPVQVCRHHHSPAVILDGIRLQKPTLLLVREPRSVMVSLLIARPDRTLWELMTAYRDYHSLLTTCRNQVVVASFDQVTSDFGKVGMRINQRYGSTFGIFSHTPESETACFRWLEQNQRDADPDVPDRIVAHPRKNRDALKAFALEELERSIRSSHRIARLMGDCEVLFEVFAKTAHDQALGGCP